MLLAANIRATPMSAWLGVATLAVGYAYYEWLRPMLAANAAALTLNSLPSLIHVAAFSLLTSYVSRVGARGRAAICLAWIAINCLFELGQRPSISDWLAATLDQRCAAAFICTRTIQFLAHGTFDDADLAASALGGALAFVTLHLLARRKENWS